ncbi:MAG: hypothetical protein ACLR0U_33320 [Enterocloster clostridioformis]
MYCEDVEGIHVHKCGAHIFHTGNRKVWEFVNSLAEFNRYTNSPVANYKGQMYNMPFNMNTFSRMWGISHRMRLRLSSRSRGRRLQVSQKPGGTGHSSGGKGIVRKINKRVYGKAVGQGLQGASGLYHQTYTCAVYL